MNKSFKLIFITAVLAAFGVVNAQEADPMVEEVVPAEEAVPAEESQSLAADPASVETPAPQVADVVKAKPKKKKKGPRISKNDFAIVDVNADFEIQGKKIMAVDAEDTFSDNNLDEWWGRANLMVSTESENFRGKVHLRMYPGEFANKVYSEDSVVIGKMVQQNRDRFEIYEAWAQYKGDIVSLKVGRMDNTTRYGSSTFGGYLDSKRDRYHDRNNNYTAMVNHPLMTSYKDIEYRASGFMSLYTPENSLQLGMSFLENLSLDVSLISTDKNLNKGDLRAYLRYEDIAGIEDLAVGLGYRSNMFDEIQSKYGDVVHMVDIGVRAPVVSDVGFLKNLVVFAEAGILGLDDQEGAKRDASGNIIPNPCDIDWWIQDELSSRCRTDIGKAYKIDWPIVGGIDISLYRGLDKIVIEAEYDHNRRKNAVNKEHVKDILGSIFVQKALNDRFTLSLGLQSEGNTKDFSLAGRLQGRIN